MVSRKALLWSAALLLTGFNIGILALNLSIQARAEVAGMSWRELARDRDFRRAVEDIVSSCTVSSGDISC